MITGVRYYSMYEPSGYGLSAQSYILGLIQAGVPVCWVPAIWGPEGYEAVPQNEAEHWIERQTELHIDLKPSVYRQIECSHVVMHTVPEFWPGLVEEGKVNIGYTAWETDAIPDHWLPLLKSVHTVLVPSNFNKLVFNKSDPNLHVKVVPHIVDPPRMIASSKVAEFRKKHDIDTECRVFYTINSWTTRKALDSLLHGFLLAFTNEDPVALIIKTSHMGARNASSPNQEFVLNIFTDILGNYVDAAQVVLIDDDSVPHEQIEILHETGDAYISLTRGEGWGMGAAQAAASGNPIIMTGWGGQMEFLPEDYPGILDYELKTVRDWMGRNSYSSNQRWAHADINQAIDKLQNLHDNYFEWKQAAEKLKQNMNNYRPDRVTDLFIQSLNDARP